MIHSIPITFQLDLYIQVTSHMKQEYIVYVCVTVQGSFVWYVGEFRSTVLVCTHNMY